MGTQTKSGLYRKQAIQTCYAVSAHEVDCEAEVAETNPAYGVPHSPAGLQSKIVNKVLDKSLKV